MKTLNVQEMENVEGGDQDVFGISSCGWAIIGTVAVTAVAAFATGGIGGFFVGKFLGTVGVISSCGGGNGY